jgi:YVTN family beta-propeller protein
MKKDAFGKWPLMTFQDPMALGTSNLTYQLRVKDRKNVTLLSLHIFQKAIFLIISSFIWPMRLYKTIISFSFFLAMIVVFAANSDVASAQSVIATLTPSPSTQLALGTQGVAVNEETNRIYITNPQNGNLSVIDGSNNTVIATLTPSPSTQLALGTQGVAVNEGTNRIYVTNPQNGNLSVIDLLSVHRALLSKVTQHLPP